jgi:hypothetical protein
MSPISPTLQETLTKIACVTAQFQGGRNFFRINTYEYPVSVDFKWLTNLNSFKCNTYEKQGGGVPIMVN